jgi:hypothetical protein
MARPKRIIQMEGATMEKPISTPIIPIATSIRERRLFRVSEVAMMFDVSERAVYLWIENGHLAIEMTPGGQKRVTGESIDKCRFRKKEEDKSE